MGSLGHKHLRHLGLVLALGLALVLLAIATSAGATAGARETVSIYTVNLAKASAHESDAAPKGPSQGDTFQSTAVVLDSKRQPAGRVHLSGVGTYRNGGIITGVLQLAAGDVLFQDATTDIDNSTLGITGGTGAYVGASGTVTSRVAKGSMEATITVVIR
jgi:hypothetical protein